MIKKFAEFILEYNGIDKKTSFDEVSMEKKGRTWYIRKNNELIKIPSVTTVLGHFQDLSFIEKWKNKVGDDVVKRETDHAKNRGTVMHKLLDVYFEETKDLKEIEEYCQKQWPKMPEEDWRCGYNLFCSFVNAGVCDKVSRTEEVEYPIGALDNGGYWGLIDFVATFNNGNKVIVDFKSAKSKRMDDTIEKYKTQLAAYVHAWNFMKEDKITNAELWISYEDQPDEPEIIELNGSEYPKYEKIFLDEVKEFHRYSDEKIKRQEFEKLLSVDDIHEILTKHNIEPIVDTVEEVREILKEKGIYHGIVNIMDIDELEYYKNKYNIDAEIIAVLKNGKIINLENK